VLDELAIAAWISSTDGISIEETELSTVLLISSTDGMLGTETLGRS